jgi:hypothetical protein
VEEQHGPGAADREITDLVDDEQRRKDERLQALGEPASLLGFLQRGDEVGQGAVVDPPAALGSGDRQADGEVRLPDSRRPCRRSASARPSGASSWATCTRTKA